MTSNAARVLAISLHNQSWFDEVYAPLLTALRSKAEFQRAENSTSAVRFLSHRPEPSAVLITDEALTISENLAVWEAVLEFARRGGTVIVMGLFPSFVRPTSMAPFFSQAGLPWGAGSYYRTTFVLNQGVVSVDKVEKLPQKYSQKALFVNNVAQRDMWYRTDDDSVVQSSVLPPIDGHVAGETAVAMSKVGKGKLGYVGDVNAEDGSNAVVLAMCGLL
ncbi:triacylglycerol lipase [Purpureocillium lilacinum]|uniref:Triacylglycerol lipase n=1 Tax=Purpureocillium lilacinum TaxID=33203 RepID=A0A179F7B3_PURLI|nr:triacylglycerol lipase [Purpureocillium lilacinum]